MFGKTTTYEFTPRYSKRTLTIDIPSDARAWQLFSVRGSGLVAYRLTQALRKAFDKLVEIVRETGDLKQGVLAAERLHSKVRYSDSACECGAGDTEPRVLAQQAIADFARAWSGNNYAEFYDCF
jgi:hypothetical protein